MDKIDSSEKNRSLDLNIFLWGCQRYKINGVVDESKIEVTVSFFFFFNERNSLVFFFKMEKLTYNEI